LKTFRIKAKWLKLNLAIVLFVGLTQSCKEPEQKNDDATQSQKVKTLFYGIDSCWATMINSDDGKISNMARICDELTLIGGNDAEKLNALKNKINTLKSDRYTQDDLLEAGAIEKYDSVTNEVIKKVFEEIEFNANAGKYQIILQLKEEITAADDSVLWYRKEYDKQIDHYNAYLSDTTNDLPKNNQNQEFKRFGQFRLIK
jgi:hypothetical protein